MGKLLSPELTAPQHPAHKARGAAPRQLPQQAWHRRHLRSMPFCRLFTVLLVRLELAWERGGFDTLAGTVDAAAAVSGCCGLQTRKEAGI